MKLRLFILPLAMALLPMAASAQNVLLPQTNSKTAAPAAKPATDKAAPQADTQAKVPPVPSTPLDDMLQKSAQSIQPQQASSGYISSALQVQLIQMEKRNITSMQDALNQSQQIQTMLASGPNAQQNQQMLAMMKQRQTSALAEAQMQMQRTQRRLDILQAGPLKTSDLSKLYQAGY